MEILDRTNIWGCMELRMLALADMELEKKQETDAAQFLRELGFQKIFLKSWRMNYEFHRYLNRSIGKNALVRGHIHEIGPFALLDLLYPEHSNLKFVESFERKKRVSKSAKSKLWAYCPRHRRRLVNEHREIFISLGKKDEGDGRVVSQTTVFSKLDFPEKWGYQLHELMEIVQFGALVELRGSEQGAVEYLDWMSNMSARIRLADPDDARGLVLFHQHLKNCLEQFEDELGKSSSQNAWFADAVAKRHCSVESLYRLIQDAVLLHWFMARKVETQKSFIFQKHEMSYRKADARAAVEYNKKWVGDKKHHVAAQYIFSAGDAFKLIGMPQASIALYTEGFRQIQLDDKSRAIMHHNLGVAYLADEKAKKALGEFKKEEHIWRTLDRGLDVCMTLASKGEAYIRLGKPELSKGAMGEALRLLSKSTGDRKAVGASLFVADSAARIKDYEAEAEALHWGMELTKNDMESDAFNFFSSRLVLLNSEDKTIFYTEDFFRHLKHPDEFPSVQSQHSYIPLVPLRGDVNNPLEGTRDV